MTRRRAWLLGLVALAVVGGGGAMYLNRPPAPPEIPLESADPAVAEAVRAARAAVEQNPRSAGAWAGLGRALLANELYPAAARRCFEEAERLDPENPRWPYFGAGLLLDRGKSDEALAKLRRAVELGARTDDGGVTPRVFLAETLFTFGEADAAADEYRRVLAVAPDHPRAHFGLAAVLAGRGDWRESRAHLERCVGSPQARKRACTSLVLVCERLGDRDGAEAYADLADRLPKDVDWVDPYAAEHAGLSRRKRDRYRVVEQLEADGQLTLAADAVAGLIRDFPDDDLPLIMMGRLLGQLGQFDAAETHLREAQRRAPDKIQPRYLEALVLYRRAEALAGTAGADPGQVKARYEAAADAARRVLERKPDYGFAHLTLGLALKQLGRPGEALDAFRRAVHCNPEYADNHLHLGLALVGAGHLPDARRSLEQARRLAPPTDPRPKEALDRHFPDKRPGPKG